MPHLTDTEARVFVFPEPETGPAFIAKCDCGFDWEAWVMGKYS